MAGEVDLGAAGAEAFLYLVHGPALHGAEVEDLITARGDQAADSEEGGLEEVVAPFFVPEGVGCGVQGSAGDTTTVTVTLPVSADRQLLTP